MRLALALALGAFFFLLFLKGVSATIGVAAEPTSVVIALTPLSPSQILNIRLWDASTTPNNYTLSISDNLKDYVSWDDCSSSYWCINKSYFVAANTGREGAITVSVLFMKKNDLTTITNGSIIAKANPITDTNGTVGISPQIEIKITVFQYETVSPSPTPTSTPTITQTQSQTQTYNSDYQEQLLEIINRTRNNTPVGYQRLNYTPPTSTNKTTERLTQTSTPTTTTTPTEKKPIPILYIIIAIIIVAGSVLGVIAFFYWY